ncbi:glucosaminidase domain-containing protein [Neobacillus drentensis]|uniref:glucosaminidase domain-containing protein n=1 Tax=Neobacillus drentensis TaxID=220684 RepID=UPI0030033E5A
MSIGPVSTDWFKNMALLSISNNVSKIASDIQPFPSSDIFQAILQSVLQEQESINLTHSNLLNKSFFTNSAPILTNIKDYTQILEANPTLNYTEVSLHKLDSALKGKLANLGEAFMEAGKKYNINPNLLASIAIHETGNGKSRAANEKNNIAGMMGKHGLKQYDSVEECIFDMARNLRKNYLDKGFDTITKIGGKYAPVGAANDPAGLNNHWVKGVNNYYCSLLS